MPLTACWWHPVLGLSAGGRSSTQCWDRLGLGPKPVVSSMNCSCSAYDVYSHGIILKSLGQSWRPNCTSYFYLTLKTIMSRKGFILSPLTLLQSPFQTQWILVLLVKKLVVSTIIFPHFVSFKLASWAIIIRNVQSYTTQTAKQLNNNWLENNCWQCHFFI